MRLESRLASKSSPKVSELASASFSQKFGIFHGVSMHFATS